MTRAGFFVLVTVILALTVEQPTSGQAPDKKASTTDGKKKLSTFGGGVMVGKTMYISGKGDYVPNEEFPGKVKNCLAEVQKSLRAAGLGMEHVVKSFVYLEDHSKFPEFNKYYGAVFPNNPPARTTLGVTLVPGPSQIEITVIAYSDLSEKKQIGTSPPGLPFSPGILAGDTLYVSGKGDQLPDGSHPSTFAEQVRQCMRNVQTTLQQAGVDFQHVVMSHLFVDKVENLAEAAAIYNESFPSGTEPACATVVVDWIPGGSHVEVTCIATTNLATRKVVRPASFQVVPGAVRASPAVWAGDTLYLSALTGFVPEKGSVVAGLKEQIDQMARNHTTVLEAASLKVDDLVGGFVYLANLDDYEPMNGVYREHYSRSGAVRTTLMPTKQDMKDVRLQASFIAARKQPAAPATK